MPCELLPWDSQFFGVTVARVTLPHLTGPSYEDILDWCTRHHVDCLYHKVPAGGDPATSAPAYGFELVDVRVELARTIDAPSPATPIGIRAARADDVPQLQSIAGSSHTLTRFYSDPHFERASCDALYRAWITRSVEGYADAVLVADEGARVNGYVTVHLESADGARIGLIAVADGQRGSGVGTRLVEAAIAWSAGHGVTRLSTATQGRNPAAVRLYERSGFLTSGIYLWYHRWFTRGTPVHDRTPNPL